MKQFDPFRLSDDLREAFIRYLLDTHRIHDSQRDLKLELERTLREPGLFVKEPLVSSIPAYVHANAAERLLNQKTPPRFHPGMKGLSSDAFDWKRPLYAHQVQAVAAIQAGRNAVVATGTGSGKTECFLLPILDHVISSPAEGVQAVIVYPMNALANDQWRRLRELVGNTPATFGRYTGQTPESERYASEKDLNEVKRPNERFTREEIRNDPPQILLTNFAMLEYLLLRPQDQNIFRHKAVRYVVLDEAHTYRGAQGIDIGLLMRRFQGLFSQPLQFILTSATLGDRSDPNVKAKIVKFASGLCGGSFNEGDVIFGDVSDPWTGSPSAELDAAQQGRLGSPEALTRLLGVLSRPDNESCEWLLSLGIGCERAETPTEMLYAALLRLAPVHRLYQQLRSGPTSVPDLTRAAFGDLTDGNAALVRWLLCAASVAKPAFEHASPLMAVRVHHFFRGLSGATVELEQANGAARVRRVYLEDRRTGDTDDISVMPLSTCVHCGMPVVTVSIQDGRWSRPRRGPVEQTLRLLTWLPLGQAQDEDDAEPLVETRWAYLSPATRAYCEGDPPEDETGFVKLTLLQGMDAEGNLFRCPNCGGVATPFPSVLREVSTGEDAPTALLAEEIVRAMPEESASLPAGGRRLLTFSDSRQRAAYFTPYLTRTTAEPSYVEPILEASKRWEESRGRPGTVQEVLDEAQKVALEHPWAIMRQTDQEGFDRYAIVPSRSINPNEKRQLLKELAITLYQHLAASPTQRTKMFGMMLLGKDIELTSEEWERARVVAPALFQDDAIGRDAVSRLLLYLVRRGAVEYWPTEVTHTHMMPGRRGPELVTLYNTAGPGTIDRRLRFRWNPFEAPRENLKLALSRSRTAAIIQQVLSHYGQNDDRMVSSVLDGLWGWLTADNSVLRSVFSGEYRLPATRILLRSKTAWYKCRKCNSPTIHPMGGRCEVPGCDGELDELREQDVRQAIASRHLACRYSREPLPLVVKEHTAQLTLERGREYQDGFVRGEINVLSSSTTFEMGVDVGTLQAVLLRNVPPSAANYIQRAGRAGRRMKGLAHAVTYARSIPHDQHHFFAPIDIVAGNVPVPVIYTANRKLTQRHVNSFLLGRFLFAHRQQLPPNTPTVLEFFGTPGGGGSPIADGFGKWCSDNRAALRDSVEKIIPQDCTLTSGDAVDEAVRSLNARPDQDDPDVYRKGVVIPFDAYMRQRQELQDEMQAAMRAGQGKKATALMGAFQHVCRLQDQLLGTSIIDLLSEYHWLPGYAFPQDVVKLTVRNAEESSRMRLERDRDQGISEYAPGSEIIADSKLFTSVGLNLTKREPELKWFSMDLSARRVRVGNNADEVRTATARMPIMFIEPMGFTTKWDEPAQEPNLFRLRPPANTDVFLIEGAKQFEEHPDVPGITTGRHSNARLFRANLGKSGKGFMICLRCGLGHNESGLPRQGSHTSPWGGTCSGRFQKMALAHIFETDVLQIRFPGHPAPPVTEAAFWMTLTAGFVASACDVLSIDRVDLDATYRSCTGEDRIGELVLYDRVPGGAGHTDRIRTSLPTILAATLERLEKCQNPLCDINASCYTCLRSHGNQFHWDVLQRGVPIQWLKALTTSG